MAGESILIVEDNPINLKLEKILLLTEKYNVITSTDAEEALQLLETYQPDLILLNAGELCYHLQQFLARF